MTFPSHFRASLIGGFFCSMFLYTNKKPNTDLVLIHLSYFSIKFVFYINKIYSHVN